jgi:hypothetical protein
MPGHIPNVVYGYRILHYKNLPFILQNGIYCPASNVKDTNYINIGKKDIINKRETKLIEIHPFGRIHDYVSFYFGPKSPMLYSIYKENSDTNCSQADIIYIVTSISTIIEKKIDFVFTTGQAIMQLSTQHNSLAELSKIDWDIIAAKFWFDRPPEYVDRVRKRMAELLIYEYLPINCILEIGVMNEKILDIVRKMVLDQRLDIPVKKVLNWYY